jgi:hypothetical protein
MARFAALRFAVFFERDVLFLIPWFNLFAMFVL